MAAHLHNGVFPCLLQRVPGRKVHHAGDADFEHLVLLLQIMMASREHWEEVKEGSLSACVKTMNCFKVLLSEALNFSLKPRLKMHKSDWAISPQRE